LSVQHQLVAVDRGWFMAKLDCVAATYMDQRVNAASFERYLAALADDIDSANASERRAVLYETPDPGAVGAEARKKLGALLASRKDKLARVTAGYTLVTPSAIARGIATAVFWLAPPPYEYSITATLSEGLAWLAARTPGLDALAVERGYATVRETALTKMGALAMQS
jgi:hypothetical protein